MNCEQEKVLRRVMELTGRLREKATVVEAESQELLELVGSLTKFVKKVEEADALLWGYLDDVKVAEATMQEFCHIDFYESDERRDAGYGRKERIDGQTVLIEELAALVEKIKKAFCWENE